MKIKTIKQRKKLTNKKVFLRVDLNVPVKNNKVKEIYKLKMIVPTIKYLQEQGTIIILASHLGRPKGEKVKKYSLEPVAKSLENLIKTKVIFSKQTVGKMVEKKISKLSSGEVILLENLRFHKEEKANEINFAKDLASLADIYVNEAFAVSHRSHASVDRIKKYLPSYAGLLLEKEINNLDLVLKSKKPLVAIVGGAKISSKIKLLQSLLKSATSILIGGAIANTFLKAKGLEMGNSMIDKDNLDWAKKFISKPQAKKKIILPSDLKILNVDNKVFVEKVSKLNKADKAYDIGPETIKDFSVEIKKAHTLMWNGPMGYFEDENFKEGTVSLARSLSLQSKKEALCVVGGGETVEAINSLNYKKYINWISTGGGAMLSFIAGESMPGLKGLIK